jgi:hypothetical protein
VNDFTAHVYWRRGWRRPRRRPESARPSGGRSSTRWLPAARGPGPSQRRARLTRRAACAHTQAAKGDALAQTAGAQLRQELRGECVII